MSSWQVGLLVELWFGGGTDDKTDVNVIKKTAKKTERKTFKKADFNKNAGYKI